MINKLYWVTLYWLRLLNSIQTFRSANNREFLCFQPPLNGVSQNAIIPKVLGSGYSIVRGHNRFLCFCLSADPLFRVEDTKSGNLYFGPFWHVLPFWLLGWIGGGINPTAGHMPRPVRATPPFKLSTQRLKFLAVLFWLASRLWVAIGDMPLATTLLKDSFRDP